MGKVWSPAGPAAASPSSALGARWSCAKPWWSTRYWATVLLPAHFAGTGGRGVGERRAPAVYNGAVLADSRPQMPMNMAGSNQGGRGGAETLPAMDRRAAGLPAGWHDGTMARWHDGAVG